MEKHYIQFQSGDALSESHLDSAHMSPGDIAPPGTPGTGEAVCRVCAGRGEVDGNECQNCGGTGSVTEGLSAGA
jgi:hypothetical protein